MSVNFKMVPSPMLEDKYQGAINELVRRYNLACEKLTEKQLAVVIRQAIACGDISVHVRVEDNARGVVYIPYREHDHLSRRVRHLEELIKFHGIKDPEACE